MGALLAPKLPFLTREPRESKAFNIDEGFCSMVKGVSLKGEWGKLWNMAMALFMQ